MSLQLLHQNLVQFPCDAMVNPTNNHLYPSGGLDLQIHQAAGPELKKDTENIGYLETGKTAFTKAYRLPCKYVIHTVGPVWAGGTSGEEELLRSCYRNALLTAMQLQCSSIAFPLISSGTYGYPKDQVLLVAMDEIRKFLLQEDLEVYLVIFDRTSYELSKQLRLSVEEYLRCHAEPAGKGNVCADVCEEELPYFSEKKGSEQKEFLRNNRMFANRIRKNSETAKQQNYRDFTAANHQNFSYGSNAPEKKTDVSGIIHLDESFSLRLLKLIDAKGMTELQAYKKAFVSKQTWSKIMNDGNYRPSKNTVISFAIALELTLEETQSLLTSAGFILSSSLLFDRLIMYFLENQIYDFNTIDATLFDYDQVTLGSIR